MALKSRDLRSAGVGYSRTASTILEAKQRYQTTAFLCHSHKDQDMALGLEATLRKAGWNVYIDWKDSTLPNVPDKTTAAKIQEKIRQLDYFLFLATENSMASRWCPWEIGFADGNKPLDKILIVPTTDGLQTYGNEYLSLYRQIDTDFRGGLVYKRPNEVTGSSLNGLV
jgi:hypothetical protein